MTITVLSNNKKEHRQLEEQAVRLSNRRKWKTVEFWAKINKGYTLTE